MFYTVVPKVIKEWFTTPNEVARAAGLIHIQLSEEFDTPQPTMVRILLCSFML